MLERQWPGFFRHYLFEELPVQEIARVFDERQGRPSKELYAISGALVLQVLLDMTDEQAVQAFCFDLRWHYALNIRGESDEDKYVCLRSLKGYRKRFIELGLEEVLFQCLSDKMLKIFRVKTSRQRLDSSHLKSAMRDLSRMQLFVEVIKKFVVELKKKAPSYYESVDDALKESYERGERSGCFAMKPSESGKQLEQVAEDLYLLVEQFKGWGEVEKLRTYGHLCRVLREQCEVVGSPEGEEKAGQNRVKLKEPKQVKSDSLQNPSDEQSTYDKHKGIGYQVQVMETYEPVEREKEEEKKEEEEEPKKRGPQLITHVQVEGANQSDVRALPRAIEDTQQRGCKPDSVLVDGAYGSYDNWQKSEKEGVELVAPANKGLEDLEKRVGYSQFTYESDGQIRSCPAGFAPVKTGRTEKGEFQTWFDRERCLECPLWDKCVVKVSRKKARLPNYSAKRAFLSAHRAYERSEEFKDKYRWRAGIEGTFSQMKRQLGANRLRVRGMRAMQFNVTLKALGINILRCAKAYERDFEDLFSSFAAFLKVQEARLKPNWLFLAA